MNWKRQPTGSVCVLLLFFFFLEESSSKNLPLKIQWKKHDGYSKPWLMCLRIAELQELRSFGTSETLINISYVLFTKGFVKIQNILQISQIRATYTSEKIVCKSFETNKSVGKNLQRFFLLWRCFYRLLTCCYLNRRFWKFTFLSQEHRWKLVENKSLQFSSWYPNSSLPGTTELYTLRFLLHSFHIATFLLARLLILLKTAASRNLTYKTNYFKARAYCQYRVKSLQITFFPYFIIDSTDHDIEP